jgi:hypothetical protein
MVLWDLTQIRTEHTTHRESSYDREGGNHDFLEVDPHTPVTLADITGPAVITHIWFGMVAKWRELLLKFTWDNAEFPSIYVPFGDFFGLGHGIVNSYQSYLFSASTSNNNKFNQSCAFNSYAQMPFRERVVVELVNESEERICVWYYVDYESRPLEDLDNCGYFHAEFHRENPFGGWGPEVQENTPETDGVMNLGEDAWNNNYVILETKGTGQYVGCNLSVANLRGTVFVDYGHAGYSWWGEGDDMIWVDGYHWPPDLHGTGSEDYFNNAWGMQKNPYLRNGASIFEFDTGGYCTSYIQHIENPIRFTKEIKVTIEIGQANHLGNDISSVAYWYAQQPTPVAAPPPVEQRRPTLKRDRQWVTDPSNQITTKQVPLTEQMLQMKREAQRKTLKPYEKTIGELVETNSGTIELKEKFFQNPELFSLALGDILEDHLGQNVKLDVLNNEYWGALVSEDGKAVSLAVTGGYEILPLHDLLQPLVGQKVKIVVGQLLDQEKSSKSDANLLLRFSTGITFRD